MSRVIVVPEPDPTRAKDLLDALRGAGESGGVVLVGGWDVHESAQWEDLTDAEGALLVFRGHLGTPTPDMVLDHITDQYGADLAEAMEPATVGSENLAARLRRGEPITTTSGSYLFGPSRKTKAPRERAASGTGTRPKVFRASDLKAAERPSWLARGRIPLSAISLLVGDEGIGKSMFWVWIVAAVTTGTGLPEFGIPARDPADVLLVVTEDDWSTTVRPRLEVAGADMDRVAVICAEEDGSGAPTFPDDIDLVMDADPKPLLVVVDAWLDTVPAKLSVRDPQQARQALHPWKEAAGKLGAAVLLLTHTNRVASASARDKYGATVELRKKARMTLFAQRGDDGLTIGPDKSNLSGTLAASKFVVEPVQFFPPSGDHDGTVPRMRCIGQADKTAAEMIAENFHGPTEDDNDVSGIRAWLRTYLMDAGKPVRPMDIKTAATTEGYSSRSLERAAKAIQVTVTRHGFPAVTHWSMPAAVGPDDLLGGGQ
ncbi:AAA family ATPase [Gordonia sp. HS-NH1]|uniref:AAA family ATPase n=1 Tax=Gordonia sp. HS-NH1 TaxID=1435068 RepID=UPI0006E1FD8F|nr:AAA family ATPase [Gordonia sp. HS-NH1]